jgi:hypothetical protein
MELGSVTLKINNQHTLTTLKRVGLFCFPTKHSTHTRWVQTTARFVCVCVFITPVPVTKSSKLFALGPVRNPVLWFLSFGNPSHPSRFKLYGTRLGDLKENWFLLFSN